MPDFSLEDLAASAGQSSGNFVKKAANKAADFACGLYKDYPGALATLPTGAFVRGFWDSLCVGRPAGLPVAPASPFIGGQCLCVKYAVTMNSKNPSGGAVFTNFPAGEFWGPIGGIRASKPPGSGAANVQVLSRGPTNRACATSQDWYDGTTTDANNIATVTVNSVSRVDGLVDNCGSLPASYSPVVIPDSRRVGNVAVVYNAGDTTTLAVSLVGPSLSLPLNIDIGGVRMIFDLGGVHLNGGTDAVYEALLNELNERLKRVEANLPVSIKPPSSKTFDEAQTNEETSGDKDNIPRLQWVQVELTGVPANAKRQDGGVGQDVLYCGWFEWVVDGYYLPREPIHFAKSMYRCPDGATGYAYTLYEGFKARITEFKRKAASV